MSSQPIANFLVRLDRACDYVPVLSTANNIVNIALKIILKSSRDLRVSLDNNFYAQHLKNKSFKRCILLSIPGIGNLIVGLIDQSKKNKSLESGVYMIRDSYYLDDEAFVKEGIQKGKFTLFQVSKRLQDNNEIARMAMEKNAENFYYASSRVQELNRDIAKKLALETNDRVLENFPQFADDEEVVLHAVSHDSRQMEHASERLKDSETFVEKVLEADIYCFDLISERLRGDKTFAEKYILRNWWCMQQVSDEIKNDLPFIKKLILVMPAVISCASKEITENKETVKELIRINPLILRYLKLENNELRELYVFGMKLISESLESDHPLQPVPITVGVFDPMALADIVLKYGKNWKKVVVLDNRDLELPSVKAAIEQVENSAA